MHLSIKRNQGKVCLFCNVSEAGSLCKPSVSGEIAIFFEAGHKTCSTAVLRKTDRQALLDPAETFVYDSAG